MHQIDVIVLAECDDTSASLVSQIDAVCGTGTYVEAADQGTGRQWIRMLYCRISGTLRDQDDDDRVSIREFFPVTGASLLVAGVHGPSKRNSDADDRAAWARRAVSTIRDVETKRGHKRTIVIGNFNMNPFDTGMIAADGFNAVMDKRLAATPRTYRGTAYERFYNPMWGRLGDESPGPAGTHYYNGGGLLTIYWHSLDQVLLRPILAPVGTPVSLDVVTHMGTASLGVVPSDRTMPDHYPIIVKLKG